MRHNELCNSWQNYHPYDCPECKTLEPFTNGKFYTEDDFYGIIEDERNEAYAEGADDTRYEMEDRMEDEYDRGYEDGKQAVLDSPEEFGLVENDS